MLPLPSIFKNCQNFTSVMNIQMEIKWYWVYKGRTIYMIIMVQAYIRICFIIHSLRYFHYNCTPFIIYLTKGDINSCWVFVGIGGYMSSIHENYIQVLKNLKRGLQKNAAILPSLQMQQKHQFPCSLQHCSQELGCESSLSTHQSMSTENIMYVRMHTVIKESEVLSWL